MNDFQKVKIISALDVGTKKISVIIAKQIENKTVKILSVQEVSSKGVKAGIVVDIKSCSEKIKEVLENAQREAKVKVSSLVVGISGDKIESFNLRTLVPVKNKVVSKEDINNSHKASLENSFIKDKKILHVLAYNYKVGSNPYVKEPWAMQGESLEALVNLITCQAWPYQNLIKACNVAGFQVQDLVLNSIASSQAVLTKTEKNLGIGVLDIGEGCLDFNAFFSGNEVFSKVIPTAGRLLSSDLAIVLKQNLLKAEEIKKIKGQVSGFNGSSFDSDARKISSILKPRVEEIFNLFKLKVNFDRLKKIMPLGIVLTGGSSYLKGIDLLAEEVLKVPVKIARPNFGKNFQVQDFEKKLSSMRFSTNFGILKFAAGGRRGEFFSSKQETKLPLIFKNLKNWLYDFL